MSLSNFTYNGLSTNPISGKAFYCYLVYDKTEGKYYSGSRGVKKSNEHDLFVKYFTSSSRREFVQRMEDDPSKFEFMVEYFTTRAEALSAEQKFHAKHNVRERADFYNRVNCNSGVAGIAGSTLCRNADGKMYRVTSEEYSTGNHIHAVTGRQMVRDKDGRTKSILKKDFDPAIHSTQFSNYVLCKDTVTGKNKRIKREVFESNSRYVGITKSVVAAFDVVEGKNCSVSKDEFHRHPERYVGITSGVFPAIELSTGNTVIIRKTDYDRTKYKHHNSGTIVRFSLLEKKSVKITCAEIAKNAHLYANSAVKHFHLVDNKLFVNIQALKEYLKTTYNIKSSRVHSKEYNKVTPLVTVISKEEYIAGSYEQFIAYPTTLQK